MCCSTSHQPTADPRWSVQSAQSMTHNLSNHDLGNANHIGEHNSELDSHADTCVIGGQAVILREYPPEHSVDITPFLARLGTVAQVPMCSALVAFDDP